ncbi:Hsp70 protein-domain-containing protein [Lentinula guzmanii]|uniref:Hsp70 protein-domain-containing protein n=1 Tax=Lentinula guzmanii TaxID=2804957 RepID=A0AA38JLT1_9AGAR|nr:Hsp70 protein-domain-containing protein [Lentinula guzmanii]
MCKIVEKKFINAALVDVQGTIGIEVNYLGERQKFSATQLMAMYLGWLRDTTSAELKTTVSDIVITVPSWFTDVQRRAILDAASITSLNVLRIINDNTAAALGYGITKSDLPDAKNPKHVAFVDLSVAIVAFSKGQLTVKSTAYDRNLGGRDTNYTLLKKVLSANAETPINVEYMNDVDAASKLSREYLEDLIADELSHIVAPIQRAIEDSGLTLDEIEAVELIGGSSRIPAVPARIAECFPGKTLSTTLNQEEAVARGATFSCVMLSPVFRVRDFSVSDINAFPIKVKWDPVPSDPEEDTKLVVFGQGNAMPSTKILSFYRKVEQENSMWENDKLIKDTEDRKNALEEYIYDTHSKLDDRYAPFVQQPEKEALLALLAQQED